MNELAVIGNSIPAMSKMAIEKVRELELMALQMPQEDINTSHVIHGGMYARSIIIPAGVMVTGALIKIATMLIVHGHVIVYIGDDSIELNGYNVLPASANRKQAFLAKSDTYMTMIFPSDAETIKDAEEQFTDEVNRLISRNCGDNHIVVTGE